MTLTLPVMILAAGLWLVLLAGCLIFLLAAAKFKRQFAAASQKVRKLQTELNSAKAQAKTIEPANIPTLDAIDEAEVLAAFDYEREELTNKIRVLENKLLDSESEIAPENAKAPSEQAVKSSDALQEKNTQLEILLKDVREDLACAEDQVATLDGAAQALQSECDSLERQLKAITETVEATSDNDVLREIIVNFTEESRELLSVIETLGKEKSELYQKIADMESGGKGTAGAVVGLKRKLTEVEAELHELKAEQGA